MIQKHEINRRTFLSVEIPMDATKLTIEKATTVTPKYYITAFTDEIAPIKRLWLPELQTGSSYRIIADSLDSEGFVKVFYPKCYCYTCTHITSIGKYFTYAIGLSDFDDDISEDCATEQAAWQSAATHITGGKRWVLVEIVNE